MLKIQKLTLGVFMTNCYFIIDSDTRYCMVVDPADDFESITEKIESDKLVLKAILLTHAHFDHIMALERLRKKYEVPVILAEEEDRILTDNELNLLSVYGDGSSCTHGDVLLHDGDTIDLCGNTISMMTLPGHTPGSCAYIFDGNMICGDTIFRDGVGRYDLPEGDYRSLRASLAKIGRLEYNYKLYPGHGPATNLEHEKNFNIYLQ